MTYKCPIECRHHNNQTDVCREICRYDESLFLHIDRKLGYLMQKEDRYNETPI